MYGAKAESRPLLSSLYAVRWLDEGRYRHVFLHSLRTPEFKLVRRVRVDRDGEPIVRGVALYDLENDPEERRPLTDPEHPDVIEAWRLLEAEMERVRERRNLLRPSPSEERTTDVAWVIRDQLRALGYVEGQADEVRRNPVLDLPWGVAPLPELGPPEAGAP